MVIGAREERGAYGKVWPLREMVALSGLTAP
jgi:hypothetical protein